MATLLIQSGDNEANVFFISMSWSAEQSKERGLSPLAPPSCGRDREQGLTSRGTDTGWQEGGENWSHQALSPPQLEWQISLPRLKSIRGGLVPPKTSSGPEAR